MGSDLANQKMSIGGKMAKWPLRPIWSACRDRNAIQSPGYVGYTIDKAVSDLKDLRKEAQMYDMKTERLTDVILTLEHAEPMSVIESVNDKYEGEYGTDSSMSEPCPYERTGNESMCKTCPVGRQVVKRLERQMKNERGRD